MDNLKNDVCSFLQFKDIKIEPHFNFIQLDLPIKPRSNHLRTYDKPASNPKNESQLQKRSFSQNHSLHSSLESFSDTNDNILSIPFVCPFYNFL
jgi:hypothetical protein